jgi:nucleotide-binding universal stress UspA family protein
VVPLDGSPAARRAIGPALVLARQAGCPLELLTVYDPVRDVWEHELDALAEATDYAAVEVSLVASSSPAHVIADLAREAGTLVCMATAGRDAVDRMLLGSVTLAVLGSKPPAVLLVGGDHEQDRAPRRFERMLVATDPSGLALAAAPQVVAWCRELAVDVDLVTVVTPEGPQGETAVRPAEELALRLEQDGVVATTTVVAADRPAVGLLEVLAQHPDALVVAAPRLHGGVRRLLVGSVTAELLRVSPVPVLLVRGGAGPR